MKLSMVMIARNEGSRIKRCFDSWWDAVDEAVLVDTGSTDDTIQTALAYAKDRGESTKLIVGEYEWKDDFAAARNYADSLATGDWRTWCDLDDEVVGLAALRKLAEEAGPEVYQFYVRYEYAVDDKGNCFCELWRERLIRAAASQGWEGRVHECQVLPPPIIFVERDVARWRHLRDFSKPTERNEKLLEQWLEEEPDNARALSYLAYELMGKRLIKYRPDGSANLVSDREKLQQSIVIYQRYLQIPGEPPEARAQNTRRLAQVYMSLGDLESAYRVSVPMLAEAPMWPDTKLTLAEVAHERQDWGKVLEFANQVLKQGTPETTLIVNPLDYTLRPKVLIASAFASCGKLEEAVKTAQQVMEVNPDFMAIGLQHQQWIAELAREQAAATWSNCAQLLVGQDEPEKALVILSTAPYFVADHSAIIAARVMVHQALAEPFKVESIGDSARGRFLVRGLKEMTEQQQTEAKRIRAEREAREQAEQEQIAAGEPGSAADPIVAAIEPEAAA